MGGTRTRARRTEGRCMTLPAPHVRDAGTGPDVVCLHCNASSSAQWRDLSDRLSSRFRMRAPDLYGAGRSPDWPSDRVITLQDELDFIAPVLQSCAGPAVLVGHSHGGAVALRAAVRQPERVRALVLYEPTLFALVDAAQPRPNGADGIRRAVADAAAALDAGDREAAARCFIDFWSGAGTWQAMPDDRKPAVAASVANVRRWGHALFGEPTPLAAFAALRMPVLYLIGGRSPRPAHAVAEVLLPVLPQARVQRFEELGHMGPLTHPQIVSAAIADFLDGL
jgi:pimeloyl-ACP methyl ester carboxylesterase